MHAFSEITPGLRQTECKHVQKIAADYIESDKLKDSYKEIIIRVDESASETDWLESDLDT